MKYREASSFDKSSINRINYIASAMQLRFHANDEMNDTQKAVFQQNADVITEGYKRQILALSESIIRDGLRDFNKLKKDFYSIYKDKKPTYKSAASTPVGSKKDFYGEYKNSKELQKMRYVYTELRGMIEVLAHQNINTNEDDIFKEQIYRNISPIKVSSKREGKRVVATSKLVTPQDLYENIRMRAEQLANISYDADIKLGTSAKRTLKDWGYNVSNMRLNNLFKAFEKNRPTYSRSYEYIKHMSNNDILLAWSKEPDLFKFVFDYNESMTSADEDLLAVLMDYDTHKLSKYRRGGALYE